MLATGVVELYLSNDLFLLLLLSWCIVLQLALIIDPQGSDRIKLSKHVEFPVEIGRCLVTSGCIGHFEWRFVEVEVQVHRLSVNCHFASARLHADHCSGSLALAVAIGSCFLVDVVRTLLGREHAAEIEQVDTVKFDEVIGIKITLAVSIVHDIVVFLLVKLG